MNEVNIPATCDRVEERIAFLYGELGDREARTFERHRKNCLVCASELTRFGAIKQSISAWRDESLRLTAFDTTNLALPAQLQWRSAWAALSSFFELSPLWLKAASGFAAVLLCLLLGLAIVGKLPGSRQPIMSQPASEQAFNEAVNKEVNRQLAQLTPEKKSGNSDVILSDDKKLRRNKAFQKQLTLASTTPVSQRKPLSRAERDQLAADLRLVADKDDATLQLLGDRINRDE